MRSCRSKAYQPPEKSELRKNQEVGMENRNKAGTLPSRGTHVTE
jgi:hypothetical protein